MRHEIEIRLTKENVDRELKTGDIVVEAEELGQVVSARMDVRGWDALVYFMGGDCYRESFGVPQTLRVLRETGEPEYEWRGRPRGTHVMTELSKTGGGTVGRRYAGTWSYRVTQNGRVIAEGDDLRTGLAKTHEEAAQELWDFLEDTVAE